MDSLPTKVVEIACSSYNNVRSFELAAGVLWLLIGENTARKRLRIALA
jgi:hypothetical protein